MGLPGVLEDLNRVGAWTSVPGSAVVSGFTWNAQDSDSQLWWPQGITTTADASSTEQVSGRMLVATSWYCTGKGANRQGSRITLVDLATLRYRHVLIVHAPATRWGPRLKPLHIHAGGLVWAGDHLYVAGTRRGLFTCRIEDIVRLDHPERAFGYRYVLPVRYAYRGGSTTGQEQMRYSFISVDRTSSPPALVAGEYGRDAMSTRLARYELDPASLLPAGPEGGTTYPTVLDHRGVGHMQGVAVVNGRYYLSASRGRRHHGHIYAGQPGDFVRHEGVLPPGPEDLTYWPSRDQLWSLSEYPGRRYVFGLDRAPFDA